MHSSFDVNTFNIPSPLNPLISVVERFGTEILMAILMVSKPLLFVVVTRAKPHITGSFKGWFEPVMSF